MSEYGCPECGHGEANRLRREWHTVTGTFDEDGDFSEDYDECDESEYDGNYSCANCGYEFSDPELGCPLQRKCEECGLLVDECTCERCERCNELADECYCRPCQGCGCEQGYVSTLRKKLKARKKQVNPMARFAKDLTRA